VLLPDADADADADRVALLVDDAELDALLDTELVIDRDVLGDDV
jgi:hypothetical protein